MAAPAIAPRAARPCTVRKGSPRIAAALPIETRSGGAGVEIPPAALGGDGDAQRVAREDEIGVPF